MKNISFDLIKSDLVIALLLLAFSAIAAFTTTTWLPPVLPGDPGAAFFPRTALGIMFVFSLLLLFRSIRVSRTEPAEGEERKTVTIDVGGLFTTIAYSALLVAGIAVASFEISAFAFLTYMLGIRTGRWAWSAVVAVISVLVMYVCFVALLKVRLPLLFLPDYIGF